MASNESFFQPSLACLDPSSCPLMDTQFMWPISHGQSRVLGLKTTPPPLVGSFGAVVVFVDGCSLHMVSTTAPHGKSRRLLERHSRWLGSRWKDLHWQDIEIHTQALHCCSSAHDDFIMWGEAKERLLHQRENHVMHELLLQVQGRMPTQNCQNWCSLQHCHKLLAFCCGQAIVHAALPKIAVAQLHQHDKTSG